MQDDLSARESGVKRIEQEVRNDLYNFTSERHNDTICFNAVMNNNSLLLGLGAVKVRYFAEHCTQFELCRLVAIPVKLERMCGNAAQTLQLFF